MFSFIRVVLVILSPHSSRIVTRTRGKVNSYKKTNKQQFITVWVKKPESRLKLFFLTQNEEIIKDPRGHDKGVANAGETKSTNE